MSRPHNDRKIRRKGEVTKDGNIKTQTTEEKRKKEKKEKEKKEYRKETGKETALERI